MRAMLLNTLQSLSDNSSPLTLTDCPDPVPAKGEILIRVSVCGVCHTELDEIEGRTPPPSLPIILGHQVVGRVQALAGDVQGFQVGDRIGVAWIYSACGHCIYCRRGEENLCLYYRATGRDAHGGYAELMTVPAAFAYTIPNNFTDAQAAPLLCAGAVGFRSLRLTGIKDGQRLGFTGFGASAHLILKLVRHQFPHAQIFVFARNTEEQAFARELGAVWAGDTAERAPVKLHAIIDTTPVWTPVVEALSNLERGGRLIINAIRKEELDRQVLLTLDYPSHLWLEKEIKSVANVTRYDVREFLRLAAEAAIMPTIQEFALSDANRALLELRKKHIHGAKVLRIA